MSTTDGKAPTRGRQAEFQRRFIWAALAAALVVGFPIGAHLTFIMGFGFPLGIGSASFVQAHGHVQMLGWVGLFIMSISLHFIPRLSGRPLASPGWLGAILWCMVLGLMLRSIGQSVLPYLVEDAWFTPVVWSVAASGAFECLGILGYVRLLMRSLRPRENLQRAAALRPVKPYFAMMLSGWIVYAGLNLLLLLHMAWNHHIVLHPGWNLLAIEGFLGLTVIPVTFAFSIRLLPLYLHVPVPTWSVHGTASVYLTALVMQLLPTIPPLPRLLPHTAVAVAHLGMLLKASVIVWFVWRLGVLRHRSPPAGPGATSPFGRFERLVYAAYGWLTLAALSEITTGIQGLVGGSSFISQNAIQHLYFLGFVTLLILGMAVRMLPGFLHRRRIASPVLVQVTFWLGNAAVVGRLLLYLLPPAWLGLIPGGLSGIRTAFALSGLLGLVAVGCLAVNLRKTQGHAAS
ncbi:hypothetical protein NKDENANG_02021 [Candidatus Entotheonellaceae bacterium PAL068K]